MSSRCDASIAGTLTGDYDRHPEIDKPYEKFDKFVLLLRVLCSVHRGFMSNAWLSKAGNGVLMRRGGVRWSSLVETLMMAFLKKDSGAAFTSSQ